jgi:aerobic-type carbon monoxide dehydrogenase small subunit (CoxS/CutS family)
MLIVATELLAADPHPTPERIREAMAGVLCRCTGYQQILDAVEAAACPTTPTGSGSA